MKKLIIGSLLIVALSAQANTNYMLNSHLLGAEARGMRFDKSFLISYILGVSDVIDGIKSCLPTDTTGRALYDVVITYANTHSLVPENSASDTVMRALALKYPCKKQPAL